MTDIFANMTDAQIVKECEIRIKIRKEMLGEDALHYYERNTPLPIWRAEMHAKVIDRYAQKQKEAMGKLLTHIK